MRIEATDLTHWADRLDCRARLPELVRRLVHATVSDVELIDFPAGEGIDKPGPDGRVRASSTSPFVPVGQSVWELGTSKSIKSKADSDYEKRSAEPGPGILRHETTFVFVTPRRWTARDDWAASKRSEGVWADVRAYDADSLEQWLELAPAPRAWLASVVGRLSDAIPLEEAWAEWSTRTTPRTSEALVLAGRDDAEAAILRWLAAPPSVLVLASEDVREPAAFLYSVIARLPQARREQWLARAVLVNGDAGLRQLSEGGRPALVVAEEGKQDLARLAAAAGNYVLLATSRGVGATLGELDRPRVAAALELLGVEPERAKRYARDSRGHLPALRRLLGDVGSSKRHELAPLLLVGEWDESYPEDVAVVTGLVGLAEEQLNSMLRRNAIGPDAPLIQRNGHWRWVSRLDAWRQLHPGLMSADLNRFQSAALRVLTTPDPKFELPTDEEWVAALHHKQLPYSDRLVSGLVEGITLIGMQNIVAGKDGQSIADSLVHEVFHDLDTWQQWATIDPQIPLLAEASPSATLLAIRRLIARPELFSPLLEQRSGLWQAHRRYQGLVRALETLAWSPDFWLDAIDTLAKLATHEFSNSARPLAADSIREILLPWKPHTRATVDERIAAIRSIASRHETTAARLLLALIPAPHTISIGTRLPTHRGWVETGDVSVTRADYYKQVVATWEALLLLAVKAPQYWPELIAKLDELPDENLVSTALEQLASQGIGGFAEDVKVSIWKALRHQLHRHRAFADASWALPANTVARLQELYEAVEPASLTERSAWLFTHNPELPDVVGRDFREERASVIRRRAHVAQQLAAELSEQQMLAFAASVEVPGYLGVALAEANEAVALSMIIAVADEEANWARAFRNGLVAGLFFRHQYGVLSIQEITHLGTVQRARVATALPCNSETWRRVAEWGDQAEAYYWSNVEPLFTHAEKDLLVAVAKLVDHGRPAEALHALSTWREKGGHPDYALIVKVLGSAKEKGIEVEAHDLAYVLGLLRDAGQTFRRERLEFEWFWFSALDHTEYQDFVLYEELASDPHLFMELLKMVFRAEGEERREPTASEIARAQQAFHILEAWRRIPGLSDDGSIHESELVSWIRAVRRLAREHKRTRIAEEKIGTILAHSPPGSDGYWPHEKTRDVLERIELTEDLETGFHIGRRNQRGVWSKSFAEGGKQERAISSTYREHAAALRARWPTTARMLLRIAEAYEHDAQREDIRGQEDREAYLFAASARDRLAAYADELQARGTYWFELVEAEKATDQGSRQMQDALAELVSSQRLFSPEPGFVVIVPLEYRTQGAPPPLWYLDAWMKWRGAKYYVGLMTAAALYGAAHQQPQTIHILVDRPMSDLTLGAARARFFLDEDVGKRDAQQLKTETGFVRVSTPETTALDLVRFMREVGGIDRVATLLSELAEELDENRLGTAAEMYEPPVVQRVGWLLDRLGRTDLTAPLSALVQKRQAVLIPLVSGDPNAGEVNGRWNVAVSEDVQIDS